MKVGVIQMQCDDTGNQSANRDTLTRLVDQRCDDKDKPDLLLGPEFALCGYNYVDKELWKMAEPQNGPTEQFLCQLAKKHSIYLGISYLEARAAATTATNNNNSNNNATTEQQPSSSTNGSGGVLCGLQTGGEKTEEDEDELHMLNTFALAGPDGTIQGRVSKSNPCSVEAYLFTGPRDKNDTAPCHVIECPRHPSKKEENDNDSTSNEQSTLRLGVLICYENYISDELEELQKAGNLDLLLQPFSGPLADDNKPHVKESLRTMYLDCCPANAKLLNCPALYCNKVGKWKQPSPSYWLPMTFDTEFPGSSAICDADGTELGRLGPNEEGVLCANVILGRDKMPPPPQTTTTTTKVLPPLVAVPRYWGGFTNASPFLKVCKVYEFLGSRSYKSSALRKQMAKEALKR